MFKRAQGAGTVRDRSQEPPFGIDHRIDASNTSRQRGNFIEILQDVHLMGNGDAEPAESVQSAQSRHASFEMGHLEGKIDVIQSRFPECGVVHGGRQGVSHGIPDDRAKPRMRVWPRRIGWCVYGVHGTHRFKSLLSWRPAQKTAPKQMQVKMGDFLAAVLAAIDDAAEATFVNAQ